MATSVKCCLVAAMVCMALPFASVENVQGQIFDGLQYSCYRLMPQTVYEQQAVTGYKWVNETQYEEQTVKSYKPVWVTEQRERTYKVLKPVIETSEREERQIVYKPVYETTYRDETVQRTEWETTTEMREERTVVRKPIVETQYKDEQVIVRKPVTETVMQQQNVTTLRPVTTTQTVLTPSLTATNQLTYAPGNVRNRLQWLRPGYYPNTSGQLGYRTGGLYWVPQQNVGTYQVQTGYAQTYVAQQQQHTSYVPETTTVQRPVQKTTYVDEIQTRRVPVTTQKYTEETQVRQVPVTVQKPVTKHYLKRTPIQTLKYESEVVTRKIPVTRQTFVEETKTEPYTSQSVRWEEETKTVRVPRTVSRRVATQMTQLVPRTTLLSVPVDAFGNPIYTGLSIQPQIVQQQIIQPQIVQRQVVPQTTYYSTPQITTVPTPERRSVIVGPSVLTQITPEGEMVEVAKKPVEGTSDKVNGNDGSDEEADQKPELPTDAVPVKEDENANGGEKEFEGTVERDENQAETQDEAGGSGDSGAENSGAENSGAENSGAENSGAENSDTENNGSENRETVDLQAPLGGPAVPEREIEAERGDGG